MNSLSTPYQLFRYQFILFLAMAAVLTASCSGSKDDTKKKKQYTGVSKIFNDNKEAQKYRITIYADQPGNGGDRDTYEGTPGVNLDVGHSFVKLEKINADGSITSLTIGFYPTGDPSPWSPETGGGIFDDATHGYDVKRKYDVTAENFDKALEYIEGIESSKKKYNLNSYNCTDFAIGVANAAGCAVPDTQGSWTGGGGSNPGDLGEDLRGLNGGKEDND